MAEEFKYPEECRLEASERACNACAAGYVNNCPEFKSVEAAVRRRCGISTKIYLACPYSHKDKAGRERRFEAANRAAGKLMQDGHIVFSPISHSHPVAKTIGEANALSHNFWLRQDFAFIEWADEVWVLMLPGWDESTGIRLELEHVRRIDVLSGRWKRVAYMDPKTFCEVDGSCGIRA